MADVDYRGREGDIYADGLVDGQLMAYCQVAFDAMNSMVDLWKNKSASDLPEDYVDELFNIFSKVRKYTGGRSV
jgi:hypothetical protein